MTEEQKAQMIADGLLNEDGTPKEPAKDGKEPDKDPKGDGDEPKFTQAQLDAILSDRLKRDREKREAKEKADRDEAERKRLADNEDHKALAEKYRDELAALKEDAQRAKKEALLTKAGYSDEQIARYGKFVDGDTDEDLAEAVEQLKKDVPPTPKYVDPSAGNSSRSKPTQVDKEDKGREAFKRLKQMGRIRN